MRPDLPSGSGQSEEEAGSTRPGRRVALRRAGGTGATRSSRAGTGVRIQAFLPYAMVIVMLAVLSTKEPGVVSLKEVNTETAETLTLLLAGLGQTIVVLSGGVDLSVGGIISLTTVLSATEMGGGGARAILVAICVAGLGCLLGALNGAVIGVTRIQPFIVTLASWSIWSGAALLILTEPGGNVPNEWIKDGNQSFLGLDMAVWILIALIILWKVFTRTRAGVRTKALGSDRTAARLSGVPVLRTLVITYALSGLLAALAGLFLITQTATGDPTGGDEFILNSIAAVVIGGARLTGGHATAGGTIVGAFTLTLVGDLVFWFHLDANWQVVLSGLVLLGVVAISVATSRISQRART